MIRTLYIDDVCLLGGNIPELEVISMNDVGNMHITRSRHAGHLGSREGRTDHRPAELHEVFAQEARHGELQLPEYARVQCAGIAGKNGENASQRSGEAALPGHHRLSDVPCLGNSLRLQLARAMSNRQTFTWPLQSISTEIIFTYASWAQRIFSTTYKEGGLAITGFSDGQQPRQRRVDVILHDAVLAREPQVRNTEPHGLLDDGSRGGGCGHSNKEAIFCLSMITVGI